MPDSQPSALTPWKRATGVLVIFGALALYFPINRMVSGGIEARLVIDNLIPLWPVWAVPYILVILWWIAAPVWATVKMDKDLYKTMVIAALVMTLSSYVVYILYPTYVVRPELTGDGWAMDLMRLIYGNDRSYNALPSGHTYNTTLFAIFWWHWQPHLRLLWVATVLLVIPATLFTHQHNVLDPIFGIMWAFSAYAIARRITGWTPETG